MNYFELFNIPVTLQADQAALTRKYFELQKTHHPDLFAQASGEKQAEALEQSSLVNKAYKTLQHSSETIKYVLQLKGLLEEEEKYQLSPDFLIEMMELNEQATDVSGQADADSLQHALNKFQTEIYEPVEAIITNYQEGVTSEKELLQVKEYYFRKKYLDRILAGLK
ncbi:MAG: co-chaperone HscB [Sediminibacterium sp.]